MKKVFLRKSIALFSGLSAIALAASLAGAGTTEVVSSLEGVLGDSSSWYPTISSSNTSMDGRYISFWSAATNLLGQNEATNTNDIFLHDMTTGTNKLITAGPDGKPAGGELEHYTPAVSADGRFVAFATSVGILIEGTPVNAFPQVYVRDTLTGKTVMASVTPSNTPGNDVSDDPAISADGRFVAFKSKASDLVTGDTNGKADIYIRELILSGDGTSLALGPMERASVNSDGTEANGFSIEPSVSAFGSYVAFCSSATNLAAGPGGTYPANGNSQVYIRDRINNTTTLVSVSEAGEIGDSFSMTSQANSLSADGGTVAFWSPSTNLVPGDTNGKNDVFVRDWKNNKTIMASVANDGGPGNNHSGLPPDSNGFSRLQGAKYVGISGDGQSVAFFSEATNLIGANPGYTIGSIYLRDLGTQRTELVTVTGTGAPMQGTFWDPSVSYDGRYTTYMGRDYSMLDQAAFHVFRYDRGGFTVYPITPTVGAASTGEAAVKVGEPVSLKADFIDPLSGQSSHSATWNWGDGLVETIAAATEPSGTSPGQFIGSHAYAMPGVYTVKLTSTNVTKEFQYVVVYDPTSGSVTGTGSIFSPAGAYSADPAAKGEATFGFVSKYKKGANIPEGTTSFQFATSSFSFQSESYDWMVLAGNTAKYKGAGAVNGISGYKFMVSATDGNSSGKGRNSVSDTFRIKIWKEDQGVAYDNEMGKGDDATATTSITSGDIRIRN